MKTLYTLLFLIITPYLFSQSISGTVYEMETAKPMLFTTIVAYLNGKIVSATESNIEGEYKLENLEPGEYVIEYQFLGFEKYRDSISIYSDITDYSTLMIETPYLLCDYIEITCCSNIACHNGCICCGCGNTITHTKSDVIEIPKITDQKIEIENSIFPNPAYDHVTIDSEQEIDQIMIFDQLGKMVHKESILNPLHRVDLANWPSGFYTVNTLKNNSLINSEKLIIQNRL